MINRQRVFDDAVCARPLFDIATEASFTLGEAAAGEDDASRTFDIEVLAMRVAPHTAAAAAALTEAAFCGITSWQQGRATEITGRVCGGETAASAGDRYFTVVEVRAAELVFGQFADLEAGRPTAVDPARRFVRGPNAPEPAGEPADDHDAPFSCTAEGSIRECRLVGNFEQCSIRPVSMGGVGATEQEAAADALIECTRALTGWLAILNLGSLASISRSCEIVGCSATR